MVGTLAFVLFFPFFQSEQIHVRPPAFCAAKETPIEAPPVGQINVHAHYYSSGLSSYSEIRFANGFPKSIQHITIIAEYYDQKGQPLLSIAFQAAVGFPVADFQPLVQAEYVYPLPEPLAAGASLDLPGISPVTTGECPLRAQISFMDVVFSDHSHYSWSTKNWLYSAVLQDRSPAFSDEPPPSTMPKSSALLRLTIDAKGHVVSVIPVHVEPLDIVLYAEKEFRNWTFYPALKNSNAVESEALVLFLISGPQAAPYPVSLKEIPSPLIIVQIAPSKLDKLHWRAWYGQRPAANRTLHLQDEQPGAAGTP